MQIPNYLNLPEMQEFFTDPKAVLNPTREKLDEFLTNQPSLYARISYLYALAKKLTATCKLALEIKYSELYKEFKPDNTDKTAEAMVKEHKSYIEMRQTYIDAEFQENTIKAYLDGIQQRKDMLITMAGILRQEMQTGIRIFEEQIPSIMGKNGGGN